MTMTKALGFAAIAALLVLAVPSKQAGAASPINPGAAVAVQREVQFAPMATQVHWHRYHHWHRGHWHHWHHHHW